MSNLPSPGSTPADIQILLAEFDASGQSAAEFARMHGIAVWKLRYSLSRRSGKPSRRLRSKLNAGSRLLPVKIVDSTPASHPAPLELLLAGGHRLSIGAGFDAELLRRVVGTLSRC